MTQNRPAAHTIGAYDKELEAIADAVRSMRREVAGMLALVRRVLETSDRGAADEAGTRDKAINALGHELERQATVMLALREPKAVDLRFILAAIKIAVILERMGDIAKGAARKLSECGRDIPDEVAGDIRQMLDEVDKMVRNSIKGFRRFDPEFADRVWEKEEAVDSLAGKVSLALERQMRVDPDAIQDSMRLLLVARGLERIADHATNVTKIVHYVASGD